MYLKHFGMTRYPFGKELLPEELFTFAALKELEVRLAHLVELRGLGLVTGEPGSGKTTACRKVAASLHTSLHRVIYVPNSTGNVMDVYKTICWELGLPVERSRASLYRAIRAEVMRLSLESRVRPLLLVDEAHHLRSDVLEELRLLTNYDMDSHNRLGLVLIGHPELRRRLSMSVHEALSQRLLMRYHLVGMTREELPAYLNHHLRLAGTELALFEPAAQEGLHQAAQGLARRVNTLAHHALMAAALARSRGVSAEHVQAALAEVS